MFKSTTYPFFKKEGVFALTAEIGLGEKGDPRDQIQKQQAKFYTDLYHTALEICTRLF